MTLQTLSFSVNVTPLPPRHLPSTALVPFGEFITFPEHIAHSRTPPELRHLPVLRGVFNHERFDFSPVLPSHMKVTAFAVAGVKVICFQLQHGPNVVCWHANATDPYVWQMLDRWDEDGAFMVLADFSNGESILAGQEFRICPSLEELRADLVHAEERTPLFVDYIADGLLNDQLWRAATSEIPVHPLLQHVQGCLVATPCTRPVTMPAEGLSGTPAARNALYSVHPPRFFGQA